MEMFQQHEALPGSAATAAVEERMAFLKKVYGLLTLSVLFAAGTAYVTQGMVGPGMFWPVMIAYIAMVFVAQAVARKPGINVLAMFAFTGLSGVVLGMVVPAYNAHIVEQALALTVLIFAGLTFYVMSSKKDFSFMGGFLFVGLLVIIGGSLLNAFVFQSAAGEFIISAGGVILFSGFILFDTSNILRNYDVRDYTSATLALYLDILNLFLFLLRLLSNRN